MTSPLLLIPSAAIISWLMLTRAAFGIAFDTIEVRD